MFLCLLIVRRPPRPTTTDRRVPYTTRFRSETATDEGTESEIVVTGFRAALENALNAKRDSNLIIESVTAEDIGKFPDQNVAESLQRLPGIQIDRENGQGSKVRIRGLEQNVTLLNGELFVSGLEVYKVGEGNYNRYDSIEGVKIGRANVRTQII